MPLLQYRWQMVYLTAQLTIPFGSECVISDHVETGLIRSLSTNLCETRGSGDQIYKV